MRLGRTLYRCVARDEPNNIPQTELESVQRLWRNLPLSEIRQGISSTADHDFLSFHAMGTNLIPLRS